MRISETAIKLLGAVCILAGLGMTVYESGKTAGGVDERTRARNAQLEQLREDAVRRDSEIHRAEIRTTQRGAQADTARAAYSVARKRVHIVDTTHVQIDGGPVLELPAPMIQVTQRGDELARRDSLEKVSLIEWGNLWKAQAEGYRIQAETLEEQLVDERRGRWRARIRDVAIAGTLGILGGIVLGH